MGSSGTCGDAQSDRNVQTSTKGGAQPLPRTVGSLRARDSCAVYGADLRTFISLTSIAKPCDHRFAGDSTGFKGALPERGMRLRASSGLTQPAYVLFGYGKDSIERQWTITLSCN